MRHVIDAIPRISSPGHAKLETNRYRITGMSSFLRMKNAMSRTTKALLSCGVLTCFVLIAPTVHSSDDKPSEDAKSEAAQKGSQASNLFNKAQCETMPQKTSEDLWNIAECFKNQKDYRQAVASLRQVVRKDPQDIEAVFVLAWMLWEEGRYIGGREEKLNTRKALQELKNARISNPTHWLLDVEIGDFYFLRMSAPDLAYPEYITARKHYTGDFARSVDEATIGRKASIENRIARTAAAIGRKGEAVEASCRALFYDPDDKEAKKRIEDLSGSCDRKGVEDPRKKSKK